MGARGMKYREMHLLVFYPFNYVLTVAKQGRLSSKSLAACYSGEHDAGRCFIQPARRGNQQNVSLLITLISYELRYISVQLLSLPWPCPTRRPHLAAASVVGDRYFMGCVVMDATCRKQLVNPHVANKMFFQYTSILVCHITFHAVCCGGACMKWVSAVILLRNQLY